MVFRKILIILFLVLSTFSLLYCQGAKETNDNKRPVFLGYSSIVFRDSKPQDANAAIIVWTEELRKNLYLDFKQPINLSPYIFYSLKEIENALDADKIDILALSTPEYFALKERYNLVPALVGLIDDSPYSQYVILVRKDSGFNEIGDLRKKILAQPKDMYHPLINYWISNLLEKKYKMERDLFFGQLKVEEKESNAVYSVFFKKTDCAIVQKNVFTTLCALNPQIANSIQILDSSPALISLLNVYTKKSENRVKNILHWLGNNIHKSAEGQNIVKLFKVQRLSEVTGKELESTKNLIDAYNKNHLKNGRRLK
jgi:ABC-type phosphate/phosphonate transport system substrate-binding protein